MRIAKPNPDKRIWDLINTGLANTPKSTLSMVRRHRYHNSIRSHVMYKRSLRLSDEDEEKFRAQRRALLSLPIFK